MRVRVSTRCVFLFEHTSIAWCSVCRGWADDALLVVCTWFVEACLVLQRAVVHAMLAGPASSPCAGTGPAGSAALHGPRRHCASTRQVAGALTRWAAKKARTARGRIGRGGPACMGWPDARMQCVHVPTARMPMYGQAGGGREMHEDAVWGQSGCLLPRLQLHMHACASNMFGGTRNEHGRPGVSSCPRRTSCNEQEGHRRRPTGQALAATGHQRRPSSSTGGTDQAPRRSWALPAVVVLALCPGRCACTNVVPGLFHTRCCTTGACPGAR